MAEIEIGSNLVMVISLITNGILALYTLKYKSKCSHSKKNGVPVA